MNAPMPPAAFATLQVATCNLLNLARAGRVFYPNQDPYTEAEYQRKTAWIGERLRALNADIIGVQEVWDESALRAAVAASGLRYPRLLVPGAENTPDG
ncbi:MAG: endonuclease, partial [Burkholderiales bacterium]|nr:endonuclease [Burkholderiales bacterium]